MREIYPGEFDTLPPNFRRVEISDDHRLEIVVRQVKQGQRIRSVFCRNLAVDIPEKNKVIHIIFDWVTAGGNETGVMAAKSYLS